MIWSGTLIYWANDVYKIALGSRVVFRFYPESVYKALNIPYRLAEGMSWHFVFMWVFLFNGLLYVVYLTFSGQWKQILPGRNSFRDAWHVLLYDLRIRKSKPAQGKYNGAQRFAYFIIVLMGFGSILTGLAMYKPVQFTWLVSLLGGYEAARWQHFALTIGFVLFFIIHVVQVVFAGWNNFRSMITGWEIVTVPRQETDEVKEDSHG